MLETRRRRLAWLFALVLLTELALLCCASLHADHDCPGHDRCAICAVLRPEHFHILSTLLLALGLALTARAALPSPAGRTAHDTPISRRVRMND